jgi:CDP-2,3-bis-(O-geranylgeranyl)-sn-glycerol synthase
MNATTPCFQCLVQALILVLVANGAPVISHKILGEQLAWPVDKGVGLSDGRRLFGQSKTWRGVCSAMFMTTGVAVILGIKPLTGLVFGGIVMVGDLLASFIKRRLGYVESSRARGLDTIPESLLPLWLLKEPLQLHLIDIALVVGLFFLIEECVSPILYKLRIRRRPY